MLGVDLLGKADYNVFALVLGRKLVRSPTVVLHPELVDDIRGLRHEPCTERASIGHCPLRSMFDVMPHSPRLVLPSSNRAFDMAVGLKFPDRALDERGLGLPPYCNGR